MPAAKIMACMIIRIILKCEGRGLWLGARAAPSPHYNSGDGLCRRCFLLFIMFMRELN